MLLLVERRAVSWFDLMLANGACRAPKEILSAAKDDKGGMGWQEEREDRYSSTCVPTYDIYLHYD